jgi:hypothetical protein
MPKIVSHFSWIPKIKKLKLRVLKKSSIYKQAPKIATRYVSQFERKQNLKVVFLELRLKEIVNRYPFPLKWGPHYVKVGRE